MGLCIQCIQERLTPTRACDCCAFSELKLSAGTMSAGTKSADFDDDDDDDDEAPMGSFSVLGSPSGVRGATELFGVCECAVQQYSTHRALLLQ